MLSAPPVKLPRTCFSKRGNYAVAPEDTSFRALSLPALRARYGLHNFPTSTR